MSEPSSLHNQGIKIQDEADIWPMIPARSFREQQIGNAELHTGGVRLEPGGQVVSRIPAKSSEYLFFTFFGLPHCMMATYLKISSVAVLGVSSDGQV